MTLAERRARLFAEMFPDRAIVVEVTSENCDDSDLHSAPGIGAYCVGVSDGRYPFSVYLEFYLAEVELCSQGGMGNEYTASVDGELVILVADTLRAVLEQLPDEEMEE